MKGRIWGGLATAKLLRFLFSSTVLALAGQAFNAGAQAVTETILYSLVAPFTNGASPEAGLVQGSDGNFYGTTLLDGVHGRGIVFRISPSGTYTSLYSFAGPFADGAYPLGALVQGNDGNFYGTTQLGGTNNGGTVFRIGPGGSYTSLYSFGSSPTDGNNPYDGLVRGSDGNFYGTTQLGGTSNDGTVFRISSNGSETNLYSFGSVPNDGVTPAAGLVQGSDGNFYGTTTYGGTTNYDPGIVGGYGYGTVFQISPNGSYRTLYAFLGAPNDGANPYLAGLVPGSDGNFYGTTVLGGTNNDGTVFRISPSGSYTSLYSFGSSPTGGSNPYDGLVPGSDGNFYGTTFSGGTTNGGTVFRISPSGSYTSLYSFGSSPDDGNNPYAGLVQGSDGNFYGTTSSGGTNGYGTAFKLTVPLSPPANQISEIQFFNVFDSTIVALQIPSVAGETYQLQYSDSMSPTNWINTGDPALSIGGPLVLIDLTEPLPPQRFYRAVITP